MIPQKMKKAWKYLIPLLVFVVAAFVFIRITFKYKSFEGKIESLRTERYRVYDFGFYLPSFTVVPYHVKRISVRTGKDEILDLAVYPSDLNEESIGMLIKGSYKPGNILEIEGKNVILGFIDFPGPKIELKGNPTGVMKKYRIIQ